jgi:23S rRNA (cytidine1920-2'-O)/16S rRNA (cytidine1409-2'-O)-methyltransferase
MMQKPTRLDILVHQLGLAPSREQARRMIMAGEVRVDGQVADKPGTRVSPTAEITAEAGPPYVSRGGLKLERALDEFGISPAGCVVADVGASTGGFTDLWLQRGAAKVYAIDVGYGQLAWTLRQDPRVVVMERTNARHLEALPEPVQLASVDVSFISLALILPRIYSWLEEGGQAVALIKPQFEAGAEHVGKGGVVRSRQTHLDVLKRVISDAVVGGWRVLGLIRSPITGPAGNVEFLVWLGKGSHHPMIDVPRAIQQAVDSL